MVTLVTYGAEKKIHRLNRLELEKSAVAHGVVRVLCFPEVQPSDEFYRENAPIMSATTGAGFWLWKPFICLNALLAAEEGDIVVYADAGCRFRAAIQPLVNLLAGRDFLFFENDHDCRSYTKRDAFIETNCDNAQYYDCPQLDAALFLMRKNQRSVAFISNWLVHCRSRSAISDDENIHGKPNLPGFKEHRHDQALLSLLARRDLEPSEVIFLPRSAKYHFVQHHRRRNAHLPIWFWHLFHDALFESRRRAERVCI